MLVWLVLVLWWVDGFAIAMSLGVLLFVRLAILVFSVLWCLLFAFVFRFVFGRFVCLISYDCVVWVGMVMLLAVWVGFLFILCLLFCLGLFALEWCWFVLLNVRGWWVDCCVAWLPVCLFWFGLCFDLLF